jgi:hypothetical protein
VWLCCRFVEREYDSSKDMFAISAVAEEHRIEAAAGDLLFLKGLAYPGMYGEHLEDIKSSSACDCPRRSSWQHMQGAAGKLFCCKALEVFSQ